MEFFQDPWGALLAPPAGRNRRVSSNEQPNWNDGNFDMTPLPPGKTLELPVLEGPGIIHHIWMTSHAGGVGELNALSLRIYWDDQAIPAVEVPLGDFFAVGQKPAVVESVPVQVSPTGSLTCYWPMPFRRSARIVVRNDNPNRTTGLYWQVDWRQLDALPPDTMYFCARYRHEYPAVMGRDYVIADLVGRGWYVGSVLSVTLAQDGWFGEGDDFFFIDGEEIPSLQGTGTEDYFNDAWGFRPRTSLWFGQPRWQGHRAGDNGVCYRWHILDPIGFQKSLRVAIEHKGNRPLGEDAWYIERPDFFSSVAYWYQRGEPFPFGELPDYPERCVPWEERHLVRAYREVVTQRSRVQVQTIGFFGGRPSLRWEPFDGEAVLSLPFSVSEKGRYAVRLDASPNARRFQVEIDGTVVLTPSDELPDDGDILLGTHELEAGTHMLTFRTDDTRPLFVERLRLLKLPPEAVRDVKTHNEAHFIRLGIGRALYAYRLAYGELPDSLERLVEVGIMPERYRYDENGNPLRARREGEWFVVQGPHWEGRWQGLDARR